MSTSLVEAPVTNNFMTDKSAESDEIGNFIKFIKSDIVANINFEKTTKTANDNLSSSNSDSDNELTFDSKVTGNKGLADIFNRKLFLGYSDDRVYFSKTQKWIGHVTCINEQSFEAKLEDLTASGTNETVEFDFDDISEEDKPLIDIGATFYWSLGYSHENGQVSKKSIIRFQRILTWDEDCLNNAAERANRLSTNLNWE